MKRFSLLLLVCGAGFGAYFWHTGDLAPWLRAAWHKARSVTGTDPLPAEVIPEPSTTRLDAEMIAALEGEDADARYRAWGELSRV